MLHNKKVGNMLRLVFVCVVMFTVLSPSLLGGTVTNNGVSTTSTDSDLVISYLHGFISGLANTTIDGNNIDNDVINSWKAENAFNNTNTESELESHITDVDDFFTNNDGSLDDDDITDDVSTDLSDSADLLYKSELDSEAELQTQIGVDVYTVNDFTVADDITNDMMLAWNASGGSGNAAPSLNYIWNSNNNSWSGVTEANLALAMADAGKDGTVYIGDDIDTFTSTIDMSVYDGLTIDGLGHNFTKAVGVDFINITDINRPCVRNMNIIVNNGLTYPEDAGSDDSSNVFTIYAETDAHRVDFLEISNIYIDNQGEKDADAGNPRHTYNHYFHNYTAFYFNVEYDGDMGRIDSFILRDLVIDGCYEGFKFETTDSSYINAGLIDNVYLDEFQRGLSFYYNGTHGMNANVFRHVKGQVCFFTEYGVYNIAGNRNRFEDFEFIDWNTTDVNPSGVYMYNISTKAKNTYILDHSTVSMIYIDDDGLGSDIHCADRTLYYDSDYDYKVFINGSEYYCRLGEFGDLPITGTYDKTTDFESLMYDICSHDNITVKLGSGVFCPDQNIGINGKNITIEGTGDHETIIRCEAGTQYASGLFTMNGLSDCNITFRNLVFDGTGASDISIGLYFCTADSIHGLTVENCEFINWVAGAGSKAIYVRPSSDDVASEVDINHDKFMNCDYGVYFDGDGDSNITHSSISFNVFDGCPVAIAWEFVDNSSIIGNIVFNCDTTGISLTDVYDSQIFCNNILDATTGISVTNSEYNDFVGNSGYDADDIIFESELDSEAELESQIIDVDDFFTNNDGSLDDDDVSLDDVKGACTNDFHNIGGTDATDDTVSGTELDTLLFGGNGLLRRTAENTFDTITDSSSNWDTAYGWGDHDSQNYLDLDTYPDADTDSTDDYTTADFTVADDITNDMMLAWNTSNVTQITNSNSRQFPATPVGAQLASDDLQNNSGWVRLPEGGFNFTRPLKIGDGCELYGAGNGTVLSIVDGANCAVIMNYDNNTDTYNIKIHNLRIDGNCWGQGVYYDSWYDYTCGICLYNSYYAEIYSVFINGTQDNGILLDTCDQCNIHDCVFTNIAESFDEWGGTAHYSGNGIYLRRTYNSVISNCLFDNIYSNGIVLEGYSNCPHEEYTQNITVMNCNVIDTGVGYYLEDAKHCVFIACSVSCGTDDSCYGANTARGFKLSGRTDKITIGDCIIRDTYRGISTTDTSDRNLTVHDTQINDTRSYAIELQGCECDIHHNKITWIGNTGINCAGDDNKISYNYLYHCGQWSSGISIAGSNNATVTFNRIEGTGVTYPNHGIYGNNADVGSKVLFNEIDGCQNHLYLVAGLTAISDTNSWNW